MKFFSNMFGSTSRDEKWKKDGVQVHPAPTGVTMLSMRGGNMLHGPIPGDDVELYVDGQKQNEGVWQAGFVALSGVKQGEMGGPYDGGQVVWVGKPESYLTAVTGGELEGDEWPAEFVRIAKGDKPKRDPKLQETLLDEQGTASGNTASFYGVSVDVHILNDEAWFYRPEQRRGYHGRWVDEGRFAPGGMDPSIEEPVRYGDDKDIEVGRKYMENLGITSQLVADNMVALVNRATEAQKAKGKKWYYETHDWAVNWAKTWGVPEWRIAGITAAMSPQIGWWTPNQTEIAMTSNNQANAARIMHVVYDPKFHDKVFTITPEFVKEYEDLQISKAVATAKKYEAKGKVAPKTTIMTLDNYNGIDPAFPQGTNYIGKHKLEDLPADIVYLLECDYIRAMGENAAKAIMIARGADPAQILGGGGKTRSFYNNIHDPYTSQAVTVDVHMARAVLGNLGLTDAQLAAMTGKGRSYKVLDEGIRMAARRLGMKGHEAQAVGWLQWRREHPKQERSKLTRGGK